MKTLVAGSILALALSFVGESVFAESGGVWSKGLPGVVNSQIVSYSPDPVCPIFYQKRTVQGYVSPQEVCLFEGRLVSAGIFFANGGRSQFAIGYPLDQKLSVVTGACSDMTGCYYAPEQDSLIVRDLVSPSKRGLKVYRRFSDRIERHLNLLEGKVTYSFDNQQPDFVLNQFGIGGMGVSHNGKWLAVEYPGFGTGLVNLETFEVKQIRYGGIPYGYGFDPTEELAVSNDGHTVVITGVNAGFSVIEVDSRCDNGASCAIVIFTTNDFIDDFKYGTHPGFEASGGQLGLTVVGYSGVARQVLIRAAGYRPTSELSYVAFGDSFTSGEGESDDSFYIESTGSCHVSRRSYPFLLGVFMTIPLHQIRNIACTGARIGDILKGEGQLATVESSHPKLMTVTIGGNDVGFSAKLKVCAMPGVCEWAKAGPGRYQSGLEIQHLYDSLVTTYRRLAESTPWARVYAIGYPRIVSVNGMCDPITSTLLDGTERQFIEEGVSYLNRVIRAASNAAGISFIDVENSLNGRLLCDVSSQPSAVNGLRLGDDIAPVKVLPMLKVIGYESFHPTPIGHELEASSIERIYGDLNQFHPCSDCNSGIPGIPNYWGSSGDERRQKYTSFLASVELSVSSKLSIKIDPHNLEPGSQVKIEIHSEEKELGPLTIDPDGGLMAELSLPNTLEPGYHTVHLYGVSYDQQPVDLYEVIRYGSAEEINRVSINESQATISSATASVLGVSSVTTPHKNEVSSGVVKANKFHQSSTLLIVIAVALVVCIIATWLLFVRLLRN
ncbi:MAG: hypothetical protein JWM52_483 [Candidatus Saccharibacteria bacterium]|nr:hypothetical protein [Candidatus Saccharibacteria bacterium]